MDQSDVSPHDHRKALRFLGRLNHWTLSRRWIASRAVPGRVLDVATGGADIPAYLHRRGVARVAVGLDRSASALNLARELSPGVLLVRGDALRLPFADGSFDTAVAHLFFHHLDEDECVTLLREMARVARRVVVADLERSRVMYAVVGFLMWWSGNRISRQDGPVSVRRSFTPAEVANLANHALPGARLEHLGPYRWGLLYDTPLRASPGPRSPAS
jgi:SAM-dependent methyltransferase